MSKICYLFITVCLFTLNKVNAEGLPQPLATLLKDLNIPEEHVGLIVQKVGAPTPLLSLNKDKQYQPASVIKIVTAYSSLSLLGPNYAWLTSIHGELDKHSQLVGDLVVQAQGDPLLTLENWSQLWRELYLLGVHEIHGNIIIDNARYQINYQDPNLFDHQGDRVYNLVPHPLTIDFDRFALNITPINHSIYVNSNFNWPDTVIVNEVKPVDLPCPHDVEESIQVFAQQQGDQTHIHVTGEWPISCGIGQLSRRLLPNERVISSSIVQIWQQLGGKFDGKIIFNQSYKKLPELVSNHSLPLFVLIPLMDKYSNNVIARMIYLSVGNPDATQKTSFEQAEKNIRDFLQRKGIDTKPLVIKNGSGLSRESSLSPQFLNSLLQVIWQDPLGHEVIASLPLMGSEGTLIRKQTNSFEINKMYLKTGTLKSVKAVAGYVQTKKGQWYTVTCLINDDNAATSMPFIHRLLDWIYLTR
ncbi:MAG: D-alanyl-D-alanine carboxypeptidase/D-alanyl-D-alanine-endopeptidase [Betaproteobacteria bacterium]|nr:D-alanyl-D-alanine carboxypeptidase/D-alanyl-D-alanine-endopeptidase [Betaproteobacteria bacterium]